MVATPVTRDLIQIGWKKRNAGPDFDTWMKISRLARAKKVGVLLVTLYPPKHYFQIRMKIFLMSWLIMKKKKIKQSFLFHRYAKGARPMTREEVSEATALFLESGRQIQRIGQDGAVSHKTVNPEWVEVLDEWDLN
jgi:hypothetical protein